MSHLCILAALLVFVSAIAARPTEIIRLNLGSNIDVIYNGNPRQLLIGSFSSVADTHLQHSGSTPTLPGNLHGKDRLKRNTSVQNHGGIRYNGMTIKLPEGNGLANSIIFSSTEKPRTKSANRLNRIHIRIG